MTTHKKPPTLNLPVQFGNLAADLLNAVRKGRVAHKAGNVKASGHPLEESFRGLLTQSLPLTAKVASGYFYNAASKCSPEVDVLIYEDREAFRLDPAPQNQHYVPYTSVSVIGQVKNAASDLGSALTQIAKCLMAWHEMRRDPTLLPQNGRQPYQHDPITFVILGTCSDKQFAAIPKKLKAAKVRIPDYILLLDRGLVLSGKNDLLVEDDATMSFYDYRTRSSYFVCTPEGPENERPGRALLWFYFALVAKLDLDQGNNLRYHAFCIEIMRLFPIRPTLKLL